MWRLAILALIGLVAGFAVWGAARAEPVADLAARIGADRVTLAEVDARVQADDPEAWQAFYQARSRALEAIVEQRLLAGEAERQGISVDSLTAREIITAVAPVEDEEVAAFYQENQEQMGDRPLAEVQDRLREYLSASAFYQARTDYLDDLRNGAGVEVLLDPPRRQVEVGTEEPARGPVTAPVVVVEYSDFQCPYCQRAQLAVDQVATTYGDRVRIVFRDFPLAMHQQAHRAAEAGQCAHEQGAFWSYHDLLFTDVRRLREPDLERYAKEAGLDVAAFTQCLASGRYAAAVDLDLASGEALGVSGTPAFFINGRFLSGAQPFAAFREIIDDELRRAGVALP
ncbi:MAG: thioredoxin domain-containing protein [Candidatus Latescibacteria bacterium]|nr:thioredoxin domain-containing protein [Candidatus Latescibacterota bacterium]